MEIYKRIEHQNNIFTYRIDDPWIEIYLYSSSIVKKIYGQISNFKKLLPEDNTNPFIKETYSTLWNIYILYCHTPLSSRYLLDVVNVSIKKMKINIEKISESNQALGKVSKKILRMIAALDYRNFQNKIINDDLLDLLKDKRAYIILNTKCGRYEKLNGIIAEQFDIPKSQILTESEFLKRYIITDEIILFGPIRSYRNDILTSLMYKKLHFFLNDKFHELDFKNICFTNSLTRQIKANYKIINNNGVNEIDIENEEYYESPINEHSHIEFDQILNNPEFSNPSNYNDQIVKSRLAFLPSNKFVFLANDKTVDETQRSLIFDRDTGEPEIIEKKVSHFNVGDYVILRTEGGGDLLIPYANEILGDSSEQYRKLQRQWKAKLEQILSKVGTEKIIADLKSEIPIINHGNLERWVHNEKQIGLKNQDHFKIILKYIGYKDFETQNIIETMRKIKSAHSRAGNKQSLELLEDIKNNTEINITLQDKGFFKIQLKARGKIGGAMTIYRIIDFDNRDHQMPYSRCDTPYNRS